MARPADLPSAERFPHGIRARYVTGCRCDECRAANRRAYHERQARGRAAAAAVTTQGGPAPQAWTAPDGTRRTRVYKRACPGVNGRPCPKRAHLRADSTGGVCGTCRMALTWNGLVDAGPARRHIKALSRVGVGRDAVAAASDVGVTTIQDIRSGAKRKIRKATADRILAVDQGAAADRAYIPAEPTWRKVQELVLEDDFTQGEIARRLGYAAPALQLGRGRITAKNALRVDRLYRDAKGDL